MHISTTCAIILLQQLLVDLHSDSPNMRFDMTASQWQIVQLCLKGTVVCTGTRSLALPTTLSLEALEHLAR